MSASERHYKALKLQGKLTADEMKILSDDLFRLLNHKSRPKSEMQLKQELVRFCGWNRHKIFGPRPHVDDYLDFLENSGLIESDYEAMDLMSVRRSCWRKPRASPS